MNMRPARSRCNAIMQMLFRLVQDIREANHLFHVLSVESRVSNRADRSLVGKHIWNADRWGDEWNSVTLLGVLQLIAYSKTAAFNYQPDSAGATTREFQNWKWEKVGAATVRRWEETGPFIKERAMRLKEEAEEIAWMSETYLSPIPLYAGQGTSTLQVASHMLQSVRWRASRPHLLFDVSISPQVWWASVHT